MRITKRQLKRIIREEKSRLVSEMEAGRGLAGSGLPTQGQLGELHSLIDRLITIMGPDEVAAELEGIAEEIRMGV